jgi:hypothetical protein
MSPTNPLTTNATAEKRTNTAPIPSSFIILLVRPHHTVRRAAIQTNSGLAGTFAQKAIDLIVRFGIMLAILDALGT